MKDGSVLITALVALAFIVFFAVCLPLMIILLIVRCFNPKLAATIGQPIVCGFGFRLVRLAAMSKVTVIGKENIPKEPCLFVCNHRGFYDIPVCYSTVPLTHLTSFVSKDSVKKVPFLNWWMMILNCEFIDRSSPKEGLKSIKREIENVNNGWSVYIMPSGTRAKGPGVAEFKGGSFKIAERTGCPVVPVAITHTDDVFENHIPKAKPTKVTISYGKPIATKDLSRDEMRELPEIAYKEVCRMYEQYV